MTTKEYNALPKEIQNILDSFNHDNDWYKEISRIGWLLKAKGYSAVFYLGGAIDVKPMRYPKNK